MVKVLVRAVHIKERNGAKQVVLLFRYKETIYKKVWKAMLKLQYNKVLYGKTDQKKHEWIQ